MGSYFGNHIKRFRINVMYSYSISKSNETRVLKPFEIYNLKPLTTAVLVKIVEPAC